LSLRNRDAQHERERHNDAFSKTRMKNENNAEDDMTTFLKEDFEILAVVVRWR